MSFIINLSERNQQSTLLKAIKILKKAGDRLPIELPSGNKVAYVRGENFDARGFGNKFSLYKEVTRQDGTKYVTNANVIGDNVYINEVFYIDKEGSKSVYSMSPGASSTVQTKEFNPSRNYPKELKKLLSVSSVEANRYSTLADYISQHSCNRKIHSNPQKNKPIITIPKQQAKLEYTEEFPETIERAIVFENIADTRTPIKRGNPLDDVVIDDENEYKKLACPFLKPITNKVEKPLFKKPAEDSGWQVVID